MINKIAALAIEQDILALSAADFDFVAAKRGNFSASESRAVDDYFSFDRFAVGCPHDIAAVRSFYVCRFKTRKQFCAVIHCVADCRDRKLVRANDTAGWRIEGG